MRQKSFDYKAGDGTQREGQFWQDEWPHGLMSTLTFASFTPSLPPLI